MGKMETCVSFKRIEIRCAEQLPPLAAWVIEYAWSNRMMDVLEGLVPCKRQEGKLQSLTLEEPCALRVMAAQAWSVVNARDIQHFESVLELLESVYMLVPRLVTSVKHMKMMFGLKTMIIMWMLQKNHGEVSIMTKIISFFPNRLSLYRGCSKRELDLMRKCHYEFKQLAQTLLFHKKMREAYIRGQLEEQYGERYAQKLEERLFDYLQLLERDLSPSTCIGQVLRWEHPLVEGEQLLLGVLSCSPHCLPAVLKRLLYYAKATPCTSPGMSQPSACTDKEKETSQPFTGPNDMPKQTPPPAGQAGVVTTCMSHSSWKGRGEVKTKPTPHCRSWYCVDAQNEGAEQTLRKRDSSLGGKTHGTRGHGPKERGLGQNERWDQKEKRQEKKEKGWERKKLTGKQQIGVYPMQLCSRHQRWVRNILQECSVELCCQSGTIQEQCQKQAKGQSMCFLGQCPKELGCQTATIVEQYPKEVGCQTMNIVEQYPKEVGCQTMNIVEQYPKEVGCQTVNIVEQYPKEVGCQTMNIVEQYPKEMGCQTMNIVEQYPKEVGCQTVNILEQHPKHVGCQTMNIMCSAEIVSHSVKSLGTCSPEWVGQCESILERCSRELMGQSVRAVDKCSAAVRTQGVIELQQALSLTSVHPVTPPHQHCIPKSYGGSGHDTAGSLTWVKMVGLGCRISLESQLCLVQSQMLQPTVQVRRLTHRECCQATSMRSATRIRPEEEVREDSEHDREDSDDWESDFSYSELDEGSDSDSDYSPF